MEQMANIFYLDTYQVMMIKMSRRLAKADLYEVRPDLSAVNHKIFCVPFITLPMLYKRYVRVFFEGSILIHSDLIKSKFG